MGTSRTRCTSRSASTCWRNGASALIALSRVPGPRETQSRSRGIKICGPGT